MGASKSPFGAQAVAGELSPAALAVLDDVRRRHADLGVPVRLTVDRVSELTGLPHERAADVFTDLILNDVLEHRPQKGRVMSGYVPGASFQEAKP